MLACAVAPCAARPAASRTTPPPIRGRDVARGGAVLGAALGDVIIAGTGGKCAKSDFWDVIADRSVRVTSHDGMSTQSLQFYGSWGVRTALLV